MNDVSQPFSVSTASVLQIMGVSACSFNAASVLSPS